MNPILHRKTCNNSVNYNKKSKKLFKHLPINPSKFTKKIYDKIYSKFAGIMKLHDIYYLNGCDHEENLVMNLASPGNFTKTPIGGTRQFNKFIGVRSLYAGGYDWNFTPSTDGVNVKQNNCCYWVYIHSDRIFGWPIFGAANAGEHGSIRMTLGDLPPVAMIVTLDPWNAQLDVPVDINNIAGWWSTTWDGTNYVLRHGLDIVASGVKTTPADVNFSITELTQTVAGVQSGYYNANLFAIGACAGNTPQDKVFRSIDSAYRSMKIWTFMGDSTFFGFGLTNTILDSVCNKLSKLRGFTQFNQGVPNATVASFLASRVEIRKPVNSNERIFNNWLINDAVIGSTTTTQFKIDYQTVIDMEKAAGFTSKQIIIITGQKIDLGPAYNANYELFKIAAKEIATANGCQQFDLSGLDYELQPDATHQTDAGTTTQAAYLAPRVL